MTDPVAVLDGLRQPDRRSCGASVVVAARILTDPSYAVSMTPARFADEALHAHRRITSPRLGGRLQVPWPRALGTPPWAVARELRLLTSVAYAVRPVRLGRRTWPHIVGATPTRPVAVFVGDRLLPRHVVLVTDVERDVTRTYEPASGLDLEVSRQRWGSGDLGLAGWDRPWLVVRPR